MTEHPARARELRLYGRYFDLVAAGEKSTEVRVKYPRFADLAVGEVIRFRRRGTQETVDVRVTRITEYRTFEALLDGEGVSNVDPNSSRDEQLANIRDIYGPEKEALGVLAIGIELLGP